MYVYIYIYICVCIYIYIYVYIFIYLHAGATSTVTAEERKRWAESINVTIVGDDGDVKIPGGWSPEGNHRWNSNTKFIFTYIYIERERDIINITCF